MNAQLLVAVTGTPHRAQPPTTVILLRHSCGNSCGTSNWPSTMQNQFALI